MHRWQIFLCLHSRLRLATLHGLLAKLCESLSHDAMVLFVRPRPAASRTEEVAIHVEELAHLMEALVMRVKLTLRHERFEEPVEFTWQLKVLMLHGEVHFHDIIEAIITLEMIIEARMLELLREEENDAEKTLRVIIWHREVSLSFEAPQVALC